LLYFIRKKLPQVNFTGLAGNIFKTALICVFLYFLLYFAKGLYPTTDRISLLIKDAILSLSAFAVFYLLGLLLKLDYLKSVGQSLCKRLLKK